jgi:thiol:disulfide interchange protein
VPLTITDAFTPSPLVQGLDVKVKVQWLSCNEVCIPEEAELSLSIPVKSSMAINGRAFDAALTAQPQLLKGTSSATPRGALLDVRVAGLPASLKGKRLEFFPETGDVIDNAAKWTQAWQGAIWTASVPLSAQRTKSPVVMPLVVTAGEQGWRTEAQVDAAWPRATGPTGPAADLQASLWAFEPSAGSGMPATLAATLLGALLGGLILNLMPCVFPIMAIKVLGFARHTQAQQHRAAGMAYAAGVIATFVALGALVLALRAGGEQIGWGFQLQSPLFIAALAIIFTVIGLNLAGLFEFRPFLPSALATLEVRHPTANAFLSGALAVVVASPCTAPFMAVSLGLAVTLAPPQALLVFATLGLGMALPYLLASWVPGVARRLPRPGPWMATLRQALAFPMFATVAWLAWVLGQQTGVDGAGALLLLLVALSAVIWALKLKGRARSVGMTLFAVMFALLAWATLPTLSATVPKKMTQARDGPWQDWAPGQVEKLMASGQVVFVDFTAAWCVTCQYNKRTVLSDSSVLAALSNKNVALLRADWTLRDPDITQALSKLGRNGVPVYVFYKRGAAPVVLSTVPSANEIRAAVAAL